jgi:hypothetical protein
MTIMGGRTSLTCRNNTSTNYGYDAVSRLASMSHEFAGDAHDVTFGYAYNPAGQIVSRSSNNDAFAFTGHTNESRTDTHNGLNQATASGSTSVTHDARGNTTAIGSALSPTLPTTGCWRMLGISTSMMRRDG